MSDDTHQTPFLSVGRNRVLSGSGVNDGSLSWFERADHPLLNLVVLNKIFSYMRGNDLKKCRLVCKSWNNLTIPFCRTKLQVNIGNCMIGNFVKLIETNTLGIPFGIFRLRRMKVQDESFQHFILLCGDLITEFTFERGQMVEDISLLLNSAPKLESLKVTGDIWTKQRSNCVVKLFPGQKPKLTSLKSLDSGDWSCYNSKACPTLFEELFEAAENIACLNLINWSDNAGLDVLQALDKSGKESSIQTMILSGISKEHIELVVKMARKPNGLKLQHLAFLFQQDNPNRSTDWFQIVTVFKDSLISLRAYSYSFFTQTLAPIEFPVMSKLKLLDFECTQNTIVSSDNFKITFPVLEKLFVSFSGHFNFDNFIAGTEVCPTVKSLIPRSGKITLEKLDRVLTIFPNLVMLECRVLEEDGAEVTKKIWTHLTRLEGLHLCGSLPKSDSLDSLMTGIPVQEIIEQFGSETNRNIRFDSLRQMKMENLKEHLSILGNKHRKYPSIGNLTNLRSLKLDLTGIKSDKIRGNDYMTDLTAYFGLYSLNNLRHLYVSECEFSKPCVERLVDDMDLQTWSFSSYLVNIISEKLHPKVKFVFPLDIEIGRGLY